MSDPAVLGLHEVGRIELAALRSADGGVASAVERKVEAALAGHACDAALEPWIVRERYLRLKADVEFARKREGASSLDGPGPDGPRLVDVGLKAPRMRGLVSVRRQLVPASARGVSLSWREERENSVSAAGRRLAWSAIVSAQLSKTARKTRWATPK